MQDLTFVIIVSADGLEINCAKTTRRYSTEYKNRKDFLFQFHWTMAGP